MARKRKRKLSRDGKIFALVISLAFLVTLAMSAIAANMNGKGFDGQTFWIVLLILAVVFGTVAIVLSLPVVKGKIGEARVSSKLKRLAKKNGGHVINDVIIPGEDGKTSQIDHLYICKYGVYVVETKNYAGRIYGTDGQKDWTQVLAYGRTKNKLYNPVRQNLTHIIRLKDLLNLEVEPTSVVVFVKANINNVISDYVYEIHKLKHLVRGAKVVLDDNYVEDVTNRIMEYKLNPVKTTKQHVRDIKDMKRGISNNICPRCGATLVLRHSDKGDFYGCSNYPKCRFTKKI